MTTPNIFTVANAKRAGSALAKSTDAAAMIAKRNAEADKAVGAIMFDAAVLTHFVTVTVPTVGSGKGLTSQGDYAASLGYSKAYGTLLVRLARAVVVHGVKNGTPAWTFLSRKGGDKRVGDIIARPTAEFHKALAPMLAEYKAGTYKANVNSAPNGETAAEKRAKAAEKAKSTVEVTPEQIVGSVTPAVLLRALDAMVKDLSDEDWSAVESRLETIVTRETTLRVKRATAARKAAAKRAPRKPAAPVAPESVNGETVIAPEPVAV